MSARTIGICCGVALSLLVVLRTPVITADQCLYLSAGGSISVFLIDTETGELKKVQDISLPGAGPLGTSSANRLLYATAIDSNRSPAIATFHVEPSGQLRLANSASVNLRPGYLAADQTASFLSGNHYGPGKVSVWRLERGIYRGETVQELTLEEKTHCTVFSPDNRWLLVPATGPNKVFQNRFDSTTGELKPNDPPFARGPRGDQEARQPRHLIFHPKLDIAYTTNERERPGVGVWRWNTEQGILRTIQNIVTQPADFSGVITTADLHLTPDSRFLYISNRDITDRSARTGSDTIAGFSVDKKTGQLTMIGHFDCEHVPRSFAIDTSGRFVYVAGQGDDRLGVYRIHAKTGTLSQVAQYETGAKPAWVHCMVPPGT